MRLRSRASPAGTDAPIAANGLAHGPQPEADTSVDRLGAAAADPLQGYFDAHFDAHIAAGEALTAQHELIFAKAHAAADELSNAHIAAGEALLAQYALYFAGAHATADEPGAAAAELPQSHLDANIAAGMAL